MKNLSLNRALKKRITHITKDFSINILASIIYTFARQIVVFPLLAFRLSDTDYGTLLTVIGLANVCTALVGGTLNNIRLIQNNRYIESGQSGDFLFLCTVGSALSIVFSLVLWGAFHYSWLTALLLTAHILVYNFYLYASAHFRLALDFKRNMLANLVTSAAYIPAAFLFATPTLWPAIFLIGEAAGLVYTAVTTRFYQEPLSCTPLLGETTQKFLALVLANLVTNLLMYADRMIIYPLLGAACVSYYSTASFFGKSAGIVMTPIAGVLLSYFAQKEFKASKKVFALVNGISLVCLMIFLFGCWLLAPFFTRLLYPSLYEMAAPYIFLANLGSAAGIACSMAQPMISKCCNIQWTLFIQVVYGIAYIVLSLWLLPLYGLVGFCWAAILANGLRLIMLYTIGFWKF